jgi:hypothetical protein
MKRLFFLGVAALACFFFSTGLFADATKAKGKMISGKITKVDCDNSTITVSGVKDLQSPKANLPDVTLKLNKKTKLTGVKECKEIKTGTSLYAGYTESDKGNLATELILRVKMDPKREAKKARAGEYKPGKMLNLKKEGSPSK